MTFIIQCEGCKCVEEWDANTNFIASFGQDINRVKLPKHKSESETDKEVHLCKSCYQKMKDLDNEIVAKHIKEYK